MASANTAWDELVTTTYALRRERIMSNVLNANVLSSWLLQSGNVDLASGGRTLVEELSFAENSTVKWYSGYELLDITPQSVLSAAEYPYKQLAGAVSISGLEMLQNAGKSKAISLVNARIDNLEESMQNALGTGVYSNGTGDSGKQIDGLQLLVADAPSTGIVGGINRANFSFWINQTKDASTVFSSLTSASVQALMQEVWTEIVAAPGQQSGNTGPNIIVAGSNAFVTFWNSLLEIQRLTDARKGTSGFKSIGFMGPSGEAPVFFDPQCDTNRMYFLNTKYLHLRPHSDRNFDMDGERKSVNQDAVVRHCFWAGNMTMSNAARQGVIFD